MKYGDGGKFARLRWPLISEDLSHSGCLRLPYMLRSRRIPRVRSSVARTGTRQCPGQERARATPPCGAASMMPEHRLVSPWHGPPCSAPTLGTDTRLRGWCTGSPFRSFSAAPISAPHLYLALIGVPPFTYPSLKQDDIMKELNTKYPDFEKRTGWRLDSHYKEEMPPELADAVRLPCRELSAVYRYRRVHT